MTGRRRVLIAGAALGMALSPARAVAQQARRIPRVALVVDFAAGAGAGPDPADPEVRAFVHGLRDLGLVDGRNVVVDRISLDGVVDRAPAVMNEVVKQGVDVIVTVGGPPVWAAHRATATIPIVAIVDDILDMGVIDSAARPGRNLTGIGEVDPRLHAKRVQMLKEAAPAVSRIAVLANREGPNDRGGEWRRQLGAGGRAIGAEVFWLAVDAPAEIEGAFAAIRKGRANAIYVTATYVNALHSKRIAEFALEHRLPSFGFPEDGMLLGYWADENAAFRRAATLVKKILDGAKPGDLPFEQPTRFELVINVRTAKALGLAIPRQMLLRADQLIE
ncbi:MAG: ABC transporter substrate-binding protein [Burkholderiales bacterium]|nr:ABC transporter substrate-binding protein [Burkholderiales bacterium]